MNFLLKIVEGPMKGAEVALVAGTRLKVGSADSCDIVLADASLGAVAFELDVADGAVTLITPDDEQRPLAPFEVCDFGTTSVAIGPADEPWGELVRPSRASGRAEAPAEPPGGGPAEPAGAEPPAPGGEASEGEAPSGGKKRRGGCLGCALSVLLLLSVLALAAWLSWRFWPPAREYAEGLIARVAEGREAKGGAEAEMQVKPEVPLSEIASQHGLELAEADGRPLLRGNLRRRTERLAIRALATAADPACKFDVTDDETMLSNSQELLFAYTEGAIKAVAASNRTVVLDGYAPSPAALERAIRALDKDVKGIESLDTSRVAVGGRAPEAVAESAFVKEPEPDDKTARKATAAAAAPGRADYPIAGILTAPYPCVVMRNGHRVMEGAQIGTATLVKIEADRLVLSEAGKTFEWTP